MPNIATLSLQKRITEIKADATRARAAYNQLVDKGTAYAKQILLLAETYESVWAVYLQALPGEETVAPTPLAKESNFRIENYWHIS